MVIPLKVDAKKPSVLSEPTAFPRVDSPRPPRVYPQHQICACGYTAIIRRACQVGQENGALHSAIQVSAGFGCGFFRFRPEEAWLCLVI